MPSVRIISNTSGIRPIQQFDVEDMTLLDFLIDRYGDDGFDCPTRIFKGTISQACEVDFKDFEQANQPIKQDFWIVHNPLGIDPFTVFVFTLIVATAVALLPVPELPEGTREAKKSPNNALTGQTNIARTLDRVPDIFGEVLSYPDLINPTAFEFINNVKFQDEYLCISRGYCDVDMVKTGNTLINNIEDSSFIVYQPGNFPDDIPKTNTSSEVSQQELVAPNENDVSMNSDYAASYDSGNDIGIITSPNADEWDNIDAGVTVDLVEVRTWNAAADDTEDLSGSYVVDSVAATELRLADAATVQAVWATGNLGPIRTANPQFTESYDPLVQAPAALVTVGPFLLPGDDYDEVWIDLQAPQGLAKGSNLNKTKIVDLEITIQEVDSGGNPTGSPIVRDIELSGNSSDPLFSTFKYGAAQGIVKGRRYEVSMVRTSDANLNDRELEKVQWTRLASIEFLDRSNEPNTTRIRIQTKATEQTASIQERRFNLIATRRVVTYQNGQVVGDIETGDGLVASRRFADVLLHYFLDPALGARNISNIDADTLYEIQAELDSVFDGEKGEFSFTFDNNNTPALEEMRQIANACRCFLTRSGSFFSIVRDQKQTVSRALFNRRNKKPDSETKTIRYNKFLDNDGVTFEYVDREDNEARTINLPQDLPASDPNAGLPDAVNPKKVEGTGIRNYSQAWDRAQYELNRLIYSRISVETGVGADGGLVGLNDRIDHVDGTNLAAVTSDGEVLAYDGLEVETSEPCEFEDSKNYTVILRDETGNPSDPQAVSPRGDSKKGFVLDAAPPFSLFVRGDNDYQRGTLYEFSEDGDELKNQYLVQRKAPDGEFYYTLELINYDDNYYQADDQTPPERA